MIRLQPDEQKNLAQYVYSLCSITLDESKGYLIESRLASLVEDSGSVSYAALLAKAKADISRALERKIIDAITTNETSFFRDISPFDLLRHKLIPELIDRRARAGAARIRIWSAACSTGQEALSLAIVLRERTFRSSATGTSALNAPTSARKPSSVPRPDGITASR